MSFNRIKYDECNERTNQINSLKQSLYQLDPPLLRQNNFQLNPQIINQRGGVSMDKNYRWRFYTGPVEVDSDLKNITRRSTKCVDGQYKPKCRVCGNPCQNQINENTGVLECILCKDKRTCDNNLLNMDYTYFPTSNPRIDDPACNLRNRESQNRFVSAFFDPKRNGRLENVNISTQQYVKQNFKHKGCIPSINDMKPTNK
jgi:hypothetical protein